MRGIFLFSLFIIVYGSLFPFDFYYVNWKNEGYKMLFSTSVFGGKSFDIINNILLFIPLGFASSVLISRYKDKQKYYLYLYLCTFILALGIQLLQIYIPQRTPAFYDVFWNMVGTSIGILFAGIMKRFYPHILKSDNKIALFILLTAWIFFLLTPFIFTFKMDLILQNISSLLNIYEYRISNILIFMAIWIVFGQLLNEIIHKKKNIFFSLESLFIVTVILKMFVYRNVIEPEIFTGGIIAILLSHSTHFQKINAHKFALIILLPMMLYYSLYPFEFAENPYKDFVWIPFGELFTSNVLGTLRIISYKFFVYGAIIWCFYICYPNAKWTSYFLITYAGLIEFLQHFTLFRIGGLTEIIMVVILCNFLPRKTSNFEVNTEDDNAIG